MMELEHNCNNCRYMCILNKWPDYGSCDIHPSVLFKLWEKDARTVVCPDWEEVRTNIMPNEKLNFSLLKNK